VALAVNLSMHLLYLLLYLCDFLTKTGIQTPNPDRLVTCVCADTMPLPLQGNWQRQNDMMSQHSNDMLRVMSRWCNKMGNIFTKCVYRERSSDVETSAAMNSHSNVEFLRAKEERPRSLPEAPKSFAEENEEEVDEQQQQQQLDGTPICPRSVSVESVEEQHSYTDLTGPSVEPQVERQPTYFGGLKEAINNARVDDIRTTMLAIVDILENGLRPNWPGRLMRYYLSHSYSI